MGVWPRWTRRFEIQGFWLDAAAAAALVEAMERRDPPLAVYHSTGRELSDALVARIESVVHDVSVTG